MRAQTVFFPMPRHPLLRMLVVAGGAILVAGIVATSLIVGAVTLSVATAWLLVRRWLGRRKRRRDGPAIIEGEFTVVHGRPRNPLPRMD